MCVCFLFWGGARNMNEHDDKPMIWVVFHASRCRTASQASRSRFARWKERRRCSSKSEWASSNWPWSRTPQWCHAMLLDAWISTPPTPISSSSQGNGSERDSTDPDEDEWWINVGRLVNGNSERQRIDPIFAINMPSPSAHPSTSMSKKALHLCFLYWLCHVSCPFLKLSLSSPRDICFVFFCRD